MSTTCPVCNTQTHRLFQKHSWWICECPQCHHRCVEISPDQQHVEEIYGDSYFFEGGDGYPDYLKEAELLTAHGRWYGQQLSRYMKPAKVLDIGAAAGFILKGLSKTGWNGTGLEPNASMAEYGRTHLNVDIKVGSLENFDSAETFDLVNMVQVLPHFYNLRQVLQAAEKLTKPSGYWLIETWNKDSLMARMQGQTGTNIAHQVCCIFFRRIRWANWLNSLDLKKLPEADRQRK